VLQEAQPYDWRDAEGSWQQMSVPLLAANRVVLNGTMVPLLDATKPIWAEVSRTDTHVTFEATIADEDDRPIARITRRWIIGDSYDLTCIQRIANLTDAPLQLQWTQYGPGDLIVDRSRYMDRRRFRFGYLLDPVNLPDLIDSGNGDLLVEHGTAVKRFDKAFKTLDLDRRQGYLSLWPNDSSRDGGFGLSWFASTNRYFALAVHPVLDTSNPGAVTGSKSIEPVVSDVLLDVPPGPKGQRIVFTGLYSAETTVAPGAEASFDLGVYAGPQDSRILGEQEPMASLAMKGLILYQMSSMCAFCTFQPLAIGLLKFLSGVHFVIGDWGLAIILLVALVRTLLHPLTKKAQVNMQRFGKAMGDLKPEIEKLQKKYPNDPKKVQQEQMRLMRERGVNPFQMLGCLPMFLQMPIWVALYAMLYFAFELRHEPAFWGVFQLFWDWPFLGDLSAADHCLWEFDEPFRFFIWNMTGINVLPLLMGLVFYFQQKYMSPPPSPSMTKEQIQQQKIMKVMMVVMFPVMLYSAPSGLTLYIFTSSLIGIIESRYVRAHIKAMDLEPPKSKKKKKKSRDPQARMYADAIDRAKQKVRSKQQGPPKKYKKRK
jgi:YidC/Oxa1 family membrane protein insertase